MPRSGCVGSGSRLSAWRVSPAPSWATSALSARDRDRSSRSAEIRRCSDLRCAHRAAGAAEYGAALALWRAGRIALVSDTRRCRQSPASAVSVARTANWKRAGGRRNRRLRAAARLCAAKRCCGNKRHHLRAARQLHRTQQQTASRPRPPGHGPRRDARRACATECCARAGPAQGGAAKRQAKAPRRGVEANALGETREAGRISARSLRPAHHAFVAGHLALAAKTALHPYERRIQREKNQGKVSATDWSSRRGGAGVRLRAGPPARAPRA